jgi:hypothetical protein
MQRQAVGKVGGTVPQVPPVFTHQLLEDRIQWVPGVTLGVQWCHHQPCSGQGVPGVAVKGVRCKDLCWCWLAAAALCLRVCVKQAP